jgi:soluble lytic murein transglycosylase-like protein
VVHYTNVPVDSRYRVILRAPSENHFMTTEGRSALQRLQRYGSLIEQMARASRIEPALVSAVVVVESGADPSALSKRGARGLMQLMPETAKRYGVHDSFDPEENIRAGSQYLRDLCERYRNDLKLVLAAYNAGPPAVDAHGGTIPPFQETIDYVPRVLELYRKLRDVTHTQPQ